MLRKVISQGSDESVDQTREGPERSLIEFCDVIREEARELTIVALERASAEIDSAVNYAARHQKRHFYLPDAAIPDLVPLHERYARWQSQFDREAHALSDGLVKRSWLMFYDAALLGMKQTVEHWLQMRYGKTMHYDFEHVTISPDD